MKLLIVIILSLLLGVTPLSESKDNYLSEIGKVYSEYSYQEYSNAYYDIIVVEGIINGKVNYGIFLFNDVANSYNVFLINTENNKLYYPKANSRGDVNVISLVLEKDVIYEVAIFNKDLIQQSTLFEFTMEPKTVEMVKASSTHLGENKGTTPISLKLLKQPFNIKAEWVQLLIAIAIGIIGVCVFIIFYYKKRNKGMFALENRTENVFNFKEFIESNETVFSSQEILTNYDTTENIQINDDSTKQTYKRYYRNVEDQYSDFDIKGHLMSKNLPAEYYGLSENDKNKVMLELMSLKDNNDITIDDYLKETMKLWKESD